MAGNVHLGHTMQAKTLTPAYIILLFYYFLGACVRGELIVCENHTVNITMAFLYVV